MSSKAHGMFDCLGSLLLITSPWLFGFTDGGAVQWVPIIAGFIILITATCTRYEFGSYMIVPLRAHLTLDVLLGIFLIASPWIFGFDDRLIWPHVAFGILEVLAGIFTKSMPSSEGAVHEH